MKWLSKIVVLLILVLVSIQFSFGESKQISSFRLDSEDIKYKKGDEFIVKLYLNTGGEDIIGFKSLINYNTGAFIVLKFKDENTKVAYWAEKLINKEKGEIKLTGGFPGGFKAEDEMLVLGVVFKVIDDKVGSTEIKINKDISSIRKNSVLIENILGNISNVVLNFNSSMSGKSVIVVEEKNIEIPKIDSSKIIAENALEIKKINEEITVIKENYKKNLEKIKNSSMILASNEKNDPESMSGELTHGASYNNLSNEIGEIKKVYMGLKVDITQVIGIQIFILGLILIFYYFYRNSIKSNVLEIKNNIAELPDTSHVSQELIK